MGKEVILSIVVPVYNTEAYLRRCLESLTCPAGKSEIVIVDDGSTDGSADVARAFCAGAGNARLLQKENGGLSSARNFGLDAAVGEYVWFVDSDDYVAPGAVEAVLEACLRQKPQILSLGSARVRDGEVRPDGYYPQELAGVCMSGAEMMRRDLLRSVCSPFMVFNREFLIANGLRFAEGLLHEDEEFTPRALYAAARVAFLPQVCYYAVARQGSITRSVNPRRTTDSVSIARRLDAFSAGVPSRNRYLFSRRITDVLNAALKLTRDYDSETVAEVNRLFYANRRLLGHMLRCRRPRFVAEGLLLCLCPRRCVNVYWHIHRFASLLGQTV